MLSIDADPGWTIVFSGVGDLHARVVTEGGDRALASLPGALGKDSVCLSEESTSWPKNSPVVMHSRGMRSDWNLRGVESLLRCDPAVIAGWLLRDLATSGDVVIVVMKRG